ncbi:xanthine dehydrogenase family protein subunit M [Streptomyces sp. NPDC050610]|uniref:FAD binding domain-containing protein n=1 Tax=Streptomyces sp. NPDC050610 TaxID=3157097 RepID=UPI00343631E2
MKPAAFDYLAPTTLDQAVSLLATAERPAVPLAGGQSLVPLLNARRVRPATVIDLNRVLGLDGIRITQDTVMIGATTRLHTLETDAALGACLPVIAQTVSHVAHRYIRHRGTCGGSLCHADPAAQLPASVLALDARLVLLGPRGTRVVAAEDFFQGPHLTALGPDELLTSVEIPRRPHARHRFEEVPRRGSANGPLVGVCVTVGLDGPVVTSARIAAAGVADRPLRLRDAEHALIGHPIDGVPDTVARTAAASVAPSDDLHAGADYRAAMLRVVIRRALARMAVERSSP